MLEANNTVSPLLQVVVTAGKAAHQAAFKARRADGQFLDVGYSSGAMILAAVLRA